MIWSPPQTPLLFLKKPWAKTLPSSTLFQVIQLWVGEVSVKKGGDSISHLLENSGKNQKCPPQGANPGCIADYFNKLSASKF